MISYKAKEIKDRLLEFCTLMSFEYQGIECSIDPFNPNDFHINVGGDERDVDSIDKVMGTPIFDGSCLNDIADEIKILEW